MANRTEQPAAQNVDVSPEAAPAAGPSAAPGGPGVRDVLVIVLQAVTGPELVGALRDHLAGAPVRVRLVTPILIESVLDHALDAVDPAIGPARERLELSLAELRKAGIEASGELGDTDPMVAIADALRVGPTDEIVLITHPEDDRPYDERDLRDRVHSDFRYEVTELTVTRESTPQLLGVAHEEAIAAPDSDEQEISDNFPPLRTRDLVAMLFGVVGSLVLVVIAAAGAAGRGEGGIEGADAAKLLIAIGTLLINGAHVVALIFFQSVRYRGIFERFMSTFTIAITSVAIIVTLLI